MAKQTQISKAINNFIETNQDDITPAVTKLLKGLSQAEILEAGDGFVHLLKNDVISKSGAESLSPESLRKRVLQLNNAFTEIGINASLSSRKQHYELIFDETLLSYQSDIEDIALDIAKQSNPDDFQSPEATRPKNEKLVFVSHKWINQESRNHTKAFFKDLKEQISYSNNDSLKINLFFDLEESGGFNHHEEQLIQQNKKCEEADLALILWSLGYDSSPACQQERDYFLDKEGSNLPNKTAIVILEFGRFKDAPKSLKKRIFFNYPKESQKSLSEFWSSATPDEKHHYVAELKDAIRDALLTPAPAKPNTPKKDHAIALIRANKQAIENGSLRERYLEEGLQTPHAFNENNRSSEKRFQIVPHLSDWANTSCNNHTTPRVTVLLGDFGFGKTVTCRLLAQQLGERYQKDKTSALPIYLDLKALLNDLDKNLNAPVEHLIESMLQQTGQTANISGTDVLQYIKQKTCLLIFDGFDEIGQKLDRAQQQRIYQKLLDIIPTETYRNDNLRLSKKDDSKIDTFPSKLLISCRTHFFNHFQQESSFLIGSERHSITDNNIQRFYMAPFKAEAIQDYLCSTLGENEGKKAYEMLGEIHDLSELSSHPIMLKLICRHIPELKQLNDNGKKVNSATLYLKLFEEIGERDLEKHLIQLSDKQALLAQLALTMWLKGTTSISFKRLEEWFKHFSSEHPLLQRQISVLDQFEKLVTDLCNATLLVRDESDEYRFAHTSYLEFFRAIGLFEAIKLKNISTLIANERALKKPKKIELDHETFQFFYNWWEICDEDDQENFEEGFIRLLEHPNDIVEKAISYDCWHFCQLESHKNLTIFPHSVAPNWSELSFTEHFIASELKHLDLSSANLSSCYFHLVRFDHLQLNQVNFSDTHFTQCLFNQSNTASCQWLNTTTHLTSLPIETMSKTLKSTNKKKYLLNQHTLHSGSTSCIALSHDNNRMASADLQGNIEVWDTNTGHCLHTIQGHTQRIITIHFSHDDQLILSGSWDGTIKLWDTNTGQFIRIFESTSRISSVAFSSDSQLIVSGHFNSTIIVWNTQTGKIIRTLEDNDNAIHSIVLSYDKQLVASGTGNGSIKLWNITNGECIETLEGHASAVRSAAFSHDDQYLVSSNNRFSKTNCSIKLWSIKTRQCIRTFPANSTNTVAFSIDDKQILSSGYNEGVKLWNIKTGKHTDIFNPYVGAIESVILSHEGKYILTLNILGEIQLFDSHSLRCLHTFESIPTYLIAASMSFDTKNLITCTNNTIQRWEITENQFQLMKSISHSTFNSLTISQDRQFIISSSYDDNINVWDAKNLQCIKTFRDHDSSIKSIVLSHTNQSILYISEKNTIGVFDMKTEKRLFYISDSSLRIISAIFSYDDQSILTINRGRSIKDETDTLALWDSKTGQHIKTLKEHSTDITSITFSHDNQFILSGNRDGSIKIWKIETEECIQILEGHSSINSLDISLNDQHILSSNRDGSINLWDIKTGSIVQSFGNSTERASSVKFSEDSKKIIAIRGNKTEIYNIEKTMPIFTLAQTGKYSNGDYFSYRTEVDGTEVIEHAKGNAWRYLYSATDDSPNDIRPACEADNWDEIYES